MIPDEAVEHWLQYTDAGWVCTGCEWASETIADYWATHGVRRRNDNIPF